MLGEQILVDAGLVVEALEVRLGNELDQVAIADVVPDQDGEVVRALVAAILRATLLARPGRDVELAADDGLDAGFRRRLVEVDRAEEIAVVGERDGRELEVLGLLDEFLELRGAVEEAVLGMDVQMDEVAVLDRTLLLEADHSHSIVDGGFVEMS